MFSSSARERCCCSIPGGTLARRSIVALKDPSPVNRAHHTSGSCLGFVLLPSRAACSSVSTGRVWSAGGEAGCSRLLRAKPCFARWRARSMAASGKSASVARALQIAEEEFFTPLPLIIDRHINSLGRGIPCRVSGADA